MDDNFKIIYKILSILKSSLEDFKKRVTPQEYDISEKIRDKSIKEKNGKIKNISRKDD